MMTAVMGATAIIRQRVLVATFAEEFVDYQEVAQNPRTAFRRLELTRGNGRQRKHIEGRD